MVTDERVRLTMRVVVLATLMLLSSAACSDTKAHTTQTRADTIAGPASARVVLGTGPAEGVRHYYAAIRNGQYDSAYAMWDGAGQASGGTPEQCRRGFAQTAQTFVSIGDSVSIEGAAGSQYATVPVTVDAVLRN